MSQSVEGSSHIPKTFCLGVLSTHISFGPGKQRNEEVYLVYREVGRYNKDGDVKYSFGRGNG